MKIKWEDRKEKSERVLKNLDLWKLLSLALVLILISITLLESSLLCDLKTYDFH